MAASNRTPAFESVTYVVAATGDQFFIPTTGYGDNPNSGTMAQRLAQTQLMNPQGIEVVDSAG